ncbi:MAG: SHOCT domain-containing protein [Thermoproteota archaeon]|jgi:hypothetical protein|nr:SHOCT domain-containing protein [Thermoproteota archaeon]
MSLTDNRRKKRGQTASSSSSTIAEAEHIVADQVTYNRRAEILEYLKLFGYKPDKTILQVHIVGFFNKRRVKARSVEQREAASRRYGGTTFVVVGRTHDPSIMDLVIKPKKKREETSPGYVGYLWKSKDPQKKAPHEVIPLDFTPIHVPYPADWKNIFATKGFMVALHVPASFAKHKNKLSRALYRAGKNADVKKPWDFIEEIRSSGNEQQATEDPLSILKIRLAKGEISPQEYEKLHQTLTM